jgi:hypothetical protein
MGWLFGAIITLGALLGAIKGIADFFKWMKEKNTEEEDQDD